MSTTFSTPNKAALKGGGFNPIILMKEIADVTSRASQEAVAEGREVTDEIDGVKVVLKYQHSSGRGTVRTISDLFLDGCQYGQEVEVIPYNIFKDPWTLYAVNGLLRPDEARYLINKAGVKDGVVRLVDDPYHEPGTPHLCYLETKSLEAVVALFKESRRRHPDRYEPKEEE